jgi:hypothetical protein
VRKIHSIRILALGILKEYRTTGLGAIFYTETIRRGPPRGYRVGEMSMILENNDAMNKSARFIGGTIYKRFRIYERRL